MKPTSVFGDFKHPNKFPFKNTMEDFMLFLKKIKN